MFYNCGMGYISLRKARIRRQLTATQRALTSLYSLQEEMSTHENISYAFDSGEGSQRTTRRKFEEIQDQIDRLEAKEASLLNDLYSMGVVAVRLRRK
jgi:hypothetical protein